MNTVLDRRILTVVLAVVVLACGCAKKNRLIEGDEDPPVITSVSASELGSSSAKITWKTDEVATSQVEYGTSDSYGSQTTENVDCVVDHVVNLSGLNNGTKYHYRAKSKDINSNQGVSDDHTFTTYTQDTSKYGFESGKEGWEHETWTDSQACTSVEQSSEKQKYGAYSLKMNMDLIPKDTNKSKGEANVDRGASNLVDLDGVPVSVWYYAPAGAGGEAGKLNGVQIFVKDSNYKSWYGPWNNIDSEDTWVQVNATIGVDSPSYIDDGFSTSTVMVLGVKIGTGGGATQTYTGPIYIDAFDW